MPIIILRFRRFISQKGDLQRAVENLEMAERIDPRSSEIKYRLALIYAVLNMREKAVAKFTQSIVLDPSNSPAYRDLAPHLPRIP